MGPHGSHVLPNAAASATPAFGNGADTGAGSAAADVAACSDTVLTETSGAALRTRFFGGALGAALLAGLGGALGGAATAAVVDVVDVLDFSARLRFGLLADDTDASEGCFLLSVLRLPRLGSVASPVLMSTSAVVELIAGCALSFGAAESGVGVVAARGRRV
jgi:hypothetical protein